MQLSYVRAKNIQQQGVATLGSSCGSEEPHDSTTVTHQPSQALPFLPLLMGPGGQSFLQQSVLNILSMSAQSYRVGVNFQKHRHPCIDQLEVSAQFEAHRQGVDETRKLGRPVTHSRIQRADLQVRSSWREAFEVLNQWIEVAGIMTGSQKPSDRGLGGARAPRQQFGNPGSFCF